MSPAVNQENPKATGGYECLVLCGTAFERWRNATLDPI
jgi:hypothetical protein